MILKMKILGKKSLSSVIEIFLILLLILCLAVIITGGVIVIKNWGYFMSENVLKSLVLVYLSSWPAAGLIYQFIGIFNSLKNGKVFDNSNAKRLKNSYILSILIGAIYLINTFLLVFGNTEILEWVALYLILTYIVALVFLIFGIGLVVLNEIYKKAIQFKEENELTI